MCHATPKCGAIIEGSDNTCTLLKIPIFHTAFANDTTAEMKLLKASPNDVIEYKLLICTLDDIGLTGESQGATTNYASIYNGGIENCMSTCEKTDIFPHCHATVWTTVGADPGKATCTYYKEPAGGWVKTDVPGNKAHFYGDCPI